MTIQEVREYFNQNFTCEVLTSSDRNQSDIQDFSSKIRNNTLERYLKEDAWEDDAEGRTRVYLVRDRRRQIVLFFSLKCGSLFTTYPLDDDYRSLSPAEKTFVDKLVDTRKKGNVSYTQYIQLASDTFPKRYRLLLSIADHRFNSKKESYEMKDSNNVIKVESCFGAIELQHLCRSDAYQPDTNVGFPVGFGVFWEKIVPIIQDITQKVGCEYLYLFAADLSENSDDEKLVAYYRNALFFYPLEEEGVTVLKPAYDDGCLGLLQKTHYLDKARESAWEAFSDRVSGEASDT